MCASISKLDFTIEKKEKIYRRMTSIACAAHTEGGTQAAKRHRGSTWLTVLLFVCMFSCLLSLCQGQTRRTRSDRERCCILALEDWRGAPEDRGDRVGGVRGPDFSEPWEMRGELSVLATESESILRSRELVARSRTSENRGWALMLRGDA